MMYLKYFASIKIAIDQQLSQKGQLIGRVFLYFVIVYLFNQIFESVGAPNERFWYLAITEWLILSTPPLAFQIAEDVNSGQIVYFMLRPMSYLSLRFGECIGMLIVRFILLGLCCLGFGFLLTASMPGTEISWLLGIFFGILGVCLYSLMAVFIGLCAFWFRDIKTLIFLNLTATFCFGGLIVPLDFYSEWMRTICFWTPYPWILWWPAQLVTSGLEVSFSAVLSLGAWVLLLWIAVNAIYQNRINAFVVEGG